MFRYESLSELQWMRNLKNIALIMPKETGLQTRGHEDGDGGDRLIVGAADTNLFSAEIRHSYWYVECLRRELEKGESEHWGNGVPNVQMWLW